MELNHGNNIVFDQAQGVMRLLEMQCGVWELGIRDIPIWWFVRFRFYDRLVGYFGNEQEERVSSDNRSNVRKIPQFTSACFKSGVFGLRALNGMIQMNITKRPPRGLRLLLAIPAAFRGEKTKGIADIYFGSLLHQISDECIVIERATLSKWDLQSLLFRKEAIFFDWMLLRAILKLFPVLRKPPEIKGWSSLQSKCREVDFGSISSDHLLNMLQSVINGVSRKVLVQVEASKMLVQRLAPSVIVEIASYDSAPMALNLVAIRQNIPIVELQHGDINKQHIGYAYFIPDNYRGERPLPNKILVYGEAFRQAVLAAGTAFTLDNVVVSGFPRMSKFLKKLELEGRESLREKVRHHLGLEQDAFLFTVTTQPTISSSLSKFLEDVLRSLKERNLVVCIKPHPSEVGTWKSSYAALLRDPRVRVLQDEDIDLYELLVASDVHGTVYSTVFLECFVLGVPNIIIGCPGYTNVLQSVDQDEIIVANYQETFIAELTRLMEDAEYRHVIIEKGRQVAKRFFAVDISPEEIMIKEIDQCKIK